MKRTRIVTDAASSNNEYSDSEETVVLRKMTTVRGRGSGNLPAIRASSQLAMTHESFNESSIDRRTRHNLHLREMASQLLIPKKAEFSH